MTIFHVLKYSDIDISDILYNNKLPYLVRSQMMQWYDNAGHQSYNSPNTFETYHQEKIKIFRHFLLAYEGPL